MEHLASIKLQALKPLSEILKGSGDITDVTKTDKDNVKPDHSLPKKQKLDGNETSLSKGVVVSGKNSSVLSGGEQKTTSTSVKEHKVSHISTKKEKVSDSKPNVKETVNKSLSGVVESKTIPASLPLKVGTPTRSDSPAEEKKVSSLKIKNLGSKPFVLSPGQFYNKVIKWMSNIVILHC